MSEPLTRLQSVLAQHGELAIAVSGGIDSMTLAWVASDIVQLNVVVVHALSPAVPPAATQRVKDYARRAGWSLRLVDAGEYADPAYRANPVNRCYYCKNNLYARIRQVTDGPIAAGTNLDDLGEYRPGLTAADEHNVQHPFVQAQINKAAVRQIAAGSGLSDIAELPAQPCLASRVETGIAIDAGDLAFIDRVEEAVSAIVGPGDIRCRITAQGVRLELPSKLVDPRMGVADELDQLLGSMCADAQRQYAGRRDYRRGSAFLVEQIKVRPG